MTAHSHCSLKGLSLLLPDCGGGVIWTQSQSEKYEKQNEEAKTENRSQHMFGEARMGGGVSYYLQI